MFVHALNHSLIQLGFHTVRLRRAMSATDHCIFNRPVRRSIAAVLVVDVVDHLKWEKVVDETTNLLSTHLIFVRIMRVFLLCLFYFDRVWNNKTFLKTSVTKVQDSFFHFFLSSCWAYKTEKGGQKNLHQRVDAMQQ